MKNPYQLKPYFPLWSLTHCCFGFGDVRWGWLEEKQKIVFWLFWYASREHFYYRTFPSPWRADHGAAITTHSDNTRTVSVDPHSPLSLRATVNQLHSPTTFFHEDRPPQRSRSFLSLTQVRTVGATSGEKAPVRGKNFNGTLEQKLHLRWNLCILSHIYFTSEDNSMDLL